MGVTCRKLILCFKNHCFCRNRCFKEELYITSVTIPLNTIMQSNSVRDECITSGVSK